MVFGSVNNALFFLIIVIPSNYCFSHHSDSVSFNFCRAGIAGDGCAAWKGALNSGKTGLFNPAFTVAYLGLNVPSNKSPFQRGG